MTCNGSPGNPGVERISDADGGWDAACLGCLECRTDIVRSLDDPRIQRVVKEQNKMFKRTAKG